MTSAKGDWQAAREFSGRGLDLATRSPYLLRVRIMLEYQVGDFEQGEVYLERLMDVMRLAAPGLASGTIAMVIPLVARIAGVTDRFDIAEAAAEAAKPEATVEEGKPEAKASETAQQDQPKE